MTGKPLFGTNQAADLGYLGVGDDVIGLVVTGTAGWFQMITNVVDADKAGVTHEIRGVS